MAETESGGTNKVLIGAIATLAAALSSVATVVVRDKPETSVPSTVRYMTEEQLSNRLKLELRPIELALDSNAKTNEALARQLGSATEKIHLLEVKMHELIGTVEREGRRR